MSQLVSQALMVLGGVITVIAAFFAILFTGKQQGRQQAEAERLRQERIARDESSSRAKDAGNARDSVSTNVIRHPGSLREDDGHKRK